MNMRVFGLVLAGTLTVLSGNARADRTIFKCKTEQGMVYQKTPCTEGGETVKSERGSEFYAEIGRRGGEMRSTRMKERMAQEQKQSKK